MEGTAILRVETVQASGVRMVSADGRPFDLPHDAVLGPVGPGDLVCLVAAGPRFVAVPAPEASSPSTFGEIMGRASP